MKRLMWGDRVIGDYPDEYEPPEGCDLHDGLKSGEMVYVPSPPEPPRPVRKPQPTLVDQIIADPKELEKLRAALNDIKGDVK